VRLLPGNQGVAVQICPHRRPARRQSRSPCTRGDEAALLYLERCGQPVRLAILARRRAETLARAE